MGPELVKYYYIYYSIYSMPPKGKKPFKKKAFKKKPFRKATGKSLALNALKKESLSSIFRHYIDNHKLSRQLKMPIPDGLRTTLFAELNMVEDATAAPAGGFQIGANICWLPFNMTGYTIGPTSLVSPPGTITGEGLGVLVTNKNCTGLSRLFNTGQANCLYDSVSVIGSQITVWYYPETLSDSLSVSIMPQKGTDTNVRFSVGTIDQMPHSKFRLITTSTPHMFVSNKLNIPEFLGMDAKSYVSSQLYSVSNENSAIKGPANKYGVFWNVQRQILNNTPISAARLPYKILVSYDVVFTREATADQTEA